MLYKISYFPEPCNDNKNKKKLNQIFSNYVTKSYLIMATGIDTSKFAKKVDLANLKSVDNIYIET